MTARLALAVMALVVGIGRAAAEGPLELRGPERVIVGRPGGALITLAAGVRPPVLVTSAGTVGALTRRADGRLEASLLPPADGAPQVTVVGALDADSGELLDWIAIPLHAEAHVAVRVDRAAEVVLDVAGTPQGPFQVEARTPSVVPVMVPPGIDHAEMTAVDGAGRTTRRTLALGVPPLARVLAVCARDGAHLTVVIANADGTPGDDAGLAVQASSGELGRPELVRPGVYRLAFTAPERADRLEIALAAAIGGATPSSCAAPLTAEPPTSLRIIPAHRRTVAPGEDVALEVALEFPGLRPPAAAPPISLTVDRGTIGPDQPLAHGRITATWTAPATGGGSAVVTARAGGLVARTTIELAPIPVPAPPPRSSRVTVGVQAGYITNFARISAPVISAQLATRTPIRRLTAGLAIGYYASASTAMTARAEELSIVVHAVPVLARVGLELSPFFVGASAGVVVGSASLASASTGRIAERLVRPALGVVGGGAARLGPGRVTFELGYLHATARGATSGPLAGCSMTGGYRLAF